MTKALRSMQEDIKLIDLIVELLDARLPSSSRNPDIDRLGQGKGRLIILNKSDLADAKENARWKECLKAKGAEVLLMDSRKGANMGEIRNAVRAACAEKIARDRARGIKNRPLRAMVAGIPNVGKSTFINSFAKKAVAKTGNTPGVTKGKQWIRLSNELELLDTPGVLWPKFEDPAVGLHLALTGSVNDEILPLEELALELMRFLKAAYPGCLNGRYGISEEEADAELLLRIGERMGYLKAGAEVDSLRTAKGLLKDFRDGRLGRITIEKAE